jgi:hypothetical protein
MSSAEGRRMYDDPPLGLKWPLPMATVFRSLAEIKDHLMALDSSSRC